MAPARVLPQVAMRVATQRPSSGSVKPTAYTPGVDADMTCRGIDFRAPAAKPSPVPVSLDFERSTQLSSRTASPAVFIRETLAATGFPMVRENSAAVTPGTQSVANN